VILPRITLLSSSPRDIHQFELATHGNHPFLSGTNVAGESRGVRVVDFGYPEAANAVTDFSVRCGVLGVLFTDRAEIVEACSDLPGLSEFIEYFDLALPLAHAIDTQIVEPSMAAKKLIDEAWDDLMGKTYNGDDAFGGISSKQILKLLLDDWDK